MFEVEVSTRGLDFSIITDGFPVEVAQKLIERLASIAVITLYSEAPFKTGYLANTITKQVEGFSAVVGPTASYAVYVELGTAPHEIRPINGRVLAFMAGGKMVFTPLVHHPGTRANPFIHRTAEQVYDCVDEVFSEVWADFVGGSSQ